MTTANKITIIRILMIPAFVLMGEGVGQYLRLKEQRQQMLFNHQF